MLKQLKFVINLLALALLLVYGYFYYKSISQFWFHSGWTTDDALQQVYAFHKVFHPEVFKGDLITEVMEGYLAPAHYWLSYFITYLTGDPIMMSHWLMLIQILITFGFLFITLYQFSGFAAACLGSVWLLHARAFMQRMTGGLPRGWAAPVLAMFLYFLLKNDHKKILLVLLLGCLLHPPATLIAGTTYGLYLLLQLLRKQPGFAKPFLILILLSPVYAFVTLKVIERPKEIGSMVSFAEAEKLPEFQKPNGRFPFTPLNSILSDFENFAMQPFKSRLYTPNWEPAKTIKYFMWLICLAALAFAYFRKTVPIALWTNLVCILVIYFASRLFAFKLYVPDRHLQMPMSVFWILFGILAIWGFKKRDSAKNYLYSSGLSLVLAVIVVFASGDGLQGSANFNYAYDKRGHVFDYIKNHTSETALFAGHPTHIDALPLFGIRRAYATTETAHPFYQGYFKEILRRLEISMRAHYSRDLHEVVNLLEPEKIDYFVFSRQRFYPAKLKSEDYFEPLRPLTIELCSYQPDSYAYKQIVSTSDFTKLPYVVFVDEQSLLIDVKKLKAYLENN